MTNPPTSDQHQRKLDRTWVRWGPAVGLGIVTLFLGLALAAVIAAVSLL